MVAAAGSGQRLGAGGPKAFVEVGGRPMIEWSLEALDRSRSIGSIIVAAPAGFERDAELAASLAAPKAELIVLPGGSTRAQSINLALERVGGAGIVAIHDAARPLLSPALVDRVVGRLAAGGAEAVIAAAPIADTVKRARAPRSEPEGSDSSTIAETIDRDALWAAQTPQAFGVTALREAQAAALERGDLEQATDEAWLIEQAGGQVLIEETAGMNLKVTTAADLAVAEALLQAR